MPIRRVLLVAALAALPIEAINFLLLGTPLDVGYEPGTPWYIQSVGLQWILIHFAGLRAFDWMERLGFGHHAVVLFLGGYLETALLLAALLLAWQSFRYCNRRSEV